VAGRRIIRHAHIVSGFVFAGHRRVGRIRGLGRPRDPRTAKFIATLAQRVPAF